MPATQPNVSHDFLRAWNRHCGEIGIPRAYFHRIIEMAGTQMKQLSITLDDADLQRNLRQLADKDARQAAAWASATRPGGCQFLGRAC